MDVTFAFAIDVTHSLSVLQMELDGLNGLNRLDQPSPAVISAIEVLGYLYEQDKAAYQKTEYVDACNIGIDENQPVALEKYEILRQYKVEFLARLTAYIITVCNLADILTKAYKNVVLSAQQASVSNIFPDQATRDQMLTQRKQEIEDYRLWRNKVFAHTAFASPHRQDSQGTQAASISYYSGTGLIFGKDYISLYGCIPSVKGVTAMQLPKLSIVGHHQKIIDFCNNWNQMFSDPLEQLKKHLSSQGLNSSGT